MEAILSLALGVSNSVISVSHNSSQSQPSILNFKQFAQSNFLQARYILPHRCEKKYVGLGTYGCNSTRDTMPGAFSMFSAELVHCSVRRKTELDHRFHPDRQWFCRKQKKRAGGFTALGVPSEHFHNQAQDSGPKQSRSLNFRQDRRRWRRIFRFRDVSSSLETDVPISRRFEFSL